MKIKIIFMLSEISVWVFFFERVVNYMIVLINLYWKC